MVKITAINKSNPQDRAADNKYYAQVVANGKTDLERLAYLVSNQSTVREADCYAVILSLLHNVVDELKQGKIVKLDKLGSFQIGINSSSAETAEEVTANLVNNVRIKFRPDKRMKDSINMSTVRFTIS
jgi:predicted histone-like DNA-binding protein